MLLRGSLKAPSQRFFRLITRLFKKMCRKQEKALKHVTPSVHSLSEQRSPFRFWRNRISQEPG